MKRIVEDRAVRKSSSGSKIKAVKVKGVKKIQKPVNVKKKLKEHVNQGKGFNKLKSNTPGEKPNWNELKKKNKELKVSRKERSNDNYESVQSAKKIWEELRKSSCPAKRKAELVDDLIKLLDGKVVETMHSHEVSRILQWIFKLGSPEIKDKMVETVMTNVVEMTQSKYAVFTVKSMIKYCKPNTRKQLIAKCVGNVVKLLSNKISAPVVEELYSKFAGTQDKFAMRRGILGELFSDIQMAGNQSCLSVALERHPDMKESILGRTKTVLKKFIEKKHTLPSSLIQSVILDFLNHCSEADKLEMLESLKGDFQALMNTRDGAQVAMMIVWNSNNKEKKSMVKELKSDLVKLAMSEYGFMVLLTLIDSVDDTVLMKKAFIPIVIENAEELVGDVQGRRIILYLVAHRSPCYFHPAELALLQEADNSKYKKKENSIRKKELLDGFVEPLLHKIIANPKLWLSSGKVGLVTLEILKAGEGEVLKNAYVALAKYITEEKSTVEEDGVVYSVIEHSGLHFVFKKLIQHDKATHSKISVTFSHCLVDCVNPNVMSRWLRESRGSFLLVFMLEAGIPEVTEKLYQKLKNSATKEILKSQSTKGAEVLFKKIFEN